MSPEWPQLSRRSALKLGVGSLASAVATASLAGQGCSRLSFRALAETAEGSAAPSQSLQAKAAAKGLLYGAAASYGPLSTDANLAAAHIRDCRILVPENELKWLTVQPQPDRYDYSQGDWLAQFARSHNMQFRGHTLVWNQALPPWFDQVVTSQTAEQILTQHITAVMQHYRGQMHSWDVVNEAVAVGHTRRSDGLHPHPWLDLLGEDYIELAFRTAAAADPDTLLVYNDRWLDYETPRDQGQRTAVLNLLSRLKASGTPIHALGIQAHLNGSETRFNPNLLREFLADVASLGLKILITELDVEDKDLPADLALRDRRVAQVYQDYLSVVLDEPAVIAVLTWGLSDRYSWLSNYAARPDGLPVRPLPLDSDYQPKPAWNAIARAFDAAPQR